jgi:hypothetical protein
MAFQAISCGLRQAAARLTLCLLLAGLCGCSKKLDDGLTKFPVRGSVTVDGKPIAGLIVRLMSESPNEGNANAGFPVGVTDEQGAFQMSTNGVNDGAVPGEYAITVVWPESNEPPLRDKLGRAYATPARSKLHATIEAGENVLPPIELTQKNAGSKTKSRRRFEDD